MTGTRVIFPAQQQEKTIQLNNKDDAPSLVQIWIDAGDENSKPETAISPFLLNPQIFKMQPQQGQMVRILLNDQYDQSEKHGQQGQAGQSALPNDQESLFYLNFSEIPAIQDSDANKNKLLLVFKNRLKLFYRPKGLTSSVNDMPKQLSYEIKSQSKTGLEIQINNDSAYHANIAQIALSLNGKELATEFNRLITPKSNIVWRVTQPLPLLNINPSSSMTKASHSSHNNTNTSSNLENISISISLVNDYGSTQTHPLPRRHH